jgi:hypothetical protein
MANLNFTTKELESEEWRPIQRFQGCEVSNLGRVRSSRPSHKGHTRSLRVLKGTIGKNGYHYVNLDGIPKTVHRFTLEAFIGPRPEGMEACHGDGIRSNNRLSNLRWDTPKANYEDSVRHGTSNTTGLELGRKPKLFKYRSEQLRWIIANQSRYSQRQLSILSGVHYSSVRRICQGRYNSATLEL